MQNSSSDPKKLSVRADTADAGDSREKPLWHAPVLQRLNVDLTAAGLHSHAAVDAQHARS